MLVAVAVLSWVAATSFRSLALYPSECRPDLQHPGGHNDRALADLLDRPLGDDLQFQILGVNDNKAIDFSRSLFPGGGSLCADGVGSCFQYVVPGQYPVALYPRPVRAVQSTYGALPGELANLRTETQTLSVNPFFHTNNNLVYVNITDTVAFEWPYVYPRSYDRSMWPTDALCVSDSRRPASAFRRSTPRPTAFRPTCH